MEKGRVERKSANRSKTRRIGQLYYQQLQEELKKDENNLKAIVSIGNIYLEKEMWEHALPYFLKAQTIKPVAEIYQNIGVIYFKKKEYQKSLEYYDQAEKAGRPHDEINLNRGLVFEKLKKTKEAIHCFMDYYKKNPKIEICFKLAPLCLEAKLFKESIDYYKILIKHEENPFHYAEMGLAYSQIGDFDEAGKCYQKAKSLTQISGKYPKIEQLTFDDFVNKYPDLPKQIEEKKKKVKQGTKDYLDHVDLGNMHYIQEDYDQSLHAYQKARDEFLYQLIFKL